MKKIIALALSVMLFVSLCACAVENGPHDFATTNTSAMTDSYLPPSMGSTKTADTKSCRTSSVISAQTGWWSVAISLPALIWTASCEPVKRWKSPLQKKNCAFSIPEAWFGAKHLLLCNYIKYGAPSGAPLFMG